MLIISYKMFSQLLVEHLSVPCENLLLYHVITFPLCNV